MDETLDLIIRAKGMEREVKATQQFSNSAYSVNLKVIWLYIHVAILIETDGNQLTRKKRLACYNVNNFIADTFLIYKSGKILFQNKVLRLTFYYSHMKHMKRWRNVSFINCISHEREWFDHRHKTVGNNS